MERLKQAYALIVRFGTFRRRRVSLSPLSYASVNRTRKEYS